MGCICVNHVRATGSEKQMKELVQAARDFFGWLDDDFFCEKSCEFVFTSSYIFPKKDFNELMDSLSNTDGLHITVCSEEPSEEYNECFSFSDGKWDYEDEDEDEEQGVSNCNTVITHPSSMPYHTTGAYIQRVSYLNESGKTIFGWMVTEFTEGVYHNDEDVEVKACAETLEALTPSEKEEE